MSSEGGGKGLGRWGWPAVILVALGGNTAGLYSVAGRPLAPPPPEPLATSAQLQAVQAQLAELAAQAKALQELKARVDRLDHKVNAQEAWGQEFVRFQANMGNWEQQAAEDSKFRRTTARRLLSMEQQLGALPCLICVENRRAADCKEACKALKR